MDFGCDGRRRMTSMHDDHRWWDTDAVLGGRKSPSRTHTTTLGNAHSPRSLAAIHDQGLVSGRTGGGRSFPARCEFGRDRLANGSRSPLDANYFGVSLRQQWKREARDGGRWKGGSAVPPESSLAVLFLLSFFSASRFPLQRVSQQQRRQQRCERRPWVALQHVCYSSDALVSQLCLTRGPLIYGNGDL